MTPPEVQRRLMRYYGLDQIPEISGYLHIRADVERERLLIREVDGWIEVALELPPTVTEQSWSFDLCCQVLEGVSHFVFLAERARRELPATRLEMELQAEVDKYVLLAVEEGEKWSPTTADELHRRLFHPLCFTGAPGGDLQHRYRLANRLAARYTSALDRHYRRLNRHRELRGVLRQFYAEGQTRKLELTRSW